MSEEQEQYLGRENKARLTSNGVSMGVTTQVQHLGSSLEMTACELCRKLHTPVVNKSKLFSPPLPPHSTCTLFTSVLVCLRRNNKGIRAKTLGLYLLQLANSLIGFTLTSSGSTASPYQDWNIQTHKEETAVGPDPSGPRQETRCEVQPSSVSFAQHTFTPTSAVR